MFKFEALNLILSKFWDRAVDKGMQISKGAVKKGLMLYVRSLSQEAII